METFDELAHGLGISACLDCTADDGEKAAVCAANGILYTGICMTPAHKEHLKHRVLIRLYQLSLVKTNKSYQPHLAKLLQKDCQ